MSGVDKEQIKPPFEGQGTASRSGSSVVDAPAETRAELEIKPPGGSEAVIRDLEERRIYLIWLFQFAVLLAVIGVFGRVGASAWMWVSGSTAFVAFCAVVGRKMWLATKNADALHPRSLLFWLMKAGNWLTTLGIVAIAWAIFIRINWRGSPTAALVFCAFLLLLAFLTSGLSRYAIHHQTTPWFQFSIGVTIVPLLLAWVFATVVSWLNPRLRETMSATHLAAIRKGEFIKRTAWSESPAWTKPDKQPIVVALALSGGGYRAALIHAGLLQALDENCVPTRYLTTVSGGSIIGAYYSLGYPPEAFKEKLIRRRPGLPDDILAIHYLLLDWLWPSWSSADTYARHFVNVFFGSSNLDDTKLVPQLIVNATDIEADPDDAREVFFKGREPQNPELDGTPIADLVAASGSFPGAFEPKTVPWPKDRGFGPPVRRRFVDGGVVENLGTTGLLRFLKLKSGGSVIPSPDLILVSDASQHGRADDLPEKVELVELLSRSEEISYDTLHILIYEQLRGAFDQRVFPIQETNEKGIASLRTDEFRSALEGRNPKPVQGDIIAAEVAKYDTLKELAPVEVEKAFWVGHAIGLHYWDAINAERERLGGQGPACSSP